MISRVLLSLLTLSLISFAFAISGLPVGPVVWRHLLFAMGVVPLILGAMLYFVPVLTRTAAAPFYVLWLPVAAAILGVQVVTALQLRPEAVAWIAAMFLPVIALEIAWLWQRRIQTLGSAHPGLYWYLAALLALLLALTAIVLREVFSEYGVALRVVHLHLNLLGFLGLTAVGTLRVLLPTTLASQDPAATQYLRAQLPFAVVGVACIALGAAVWVPLSWLGAAIGLWPALVLLKVIRLDQLRAVGMHHAALPLSAAALGWFLVLLAGLAHGLAILNADVLMWLLILLFLLPLVTGASSYLLPLWRWPGKMTLAHTRMRTQLMRFSGARMLAFYLSAGLVALGVKGAQIPAVIALLSYLAQVGHAFLPDQRDATPLL